jgi:hypothetical protein
MKLIGKAIGSIVGNRTRVNEASFSLSFFEFTEPSYFASTSVSFEQRLMWPLIETSWKIC